WQVRARNENERLRFAVLDRRAAVERNDLDRLGRSPARRCRHGPAPLVAAALEGILEIRHAAGDAELAGDERHLRFDVDEQAVERPVTDDRADARLFAGPRELVIDDPGRRRQQIPLRRNADAHRAAGHEQRDRISLPIEVQAVQPHVAGVDGAEAAARNRAFARSTALKPRTSNGEYRPMFSLPTLLPNASSADFTALSSARCAWAQNGSPSRTINQARMLNSPDIVLVSVRCADSAGSLSDDGAHAHVRTLHSRRWRGCLRGRSAARRFTPARAGRRLRSVVSADAR